MVISNNATAGFILGTLNKNINKKNKASSQLALGEKIRNAGDDASGYAISEKMRVRIRALGQSDANVQNGASMLRIAEGAIQSQINLLRTVKEKVIDAHNDTNTDTDRATIQKEITQYYNEINDIAAETTFNGKHLLLGTTVSEAVKSWYKLDHAEKLEGSDKFSFVSGTEASLDGYNVTKVGDDKQLTGGTEDKANVIQLKFTSTTSVDALKNKAFKIKYPGGEEYFAFTTQKTGNPFGDNVNVLRLQIDGVSTMEERIRRAALKIQSKVQLEYEEYTVDGRTDWTIKLTTIEKGEDTNKESMYDIVGVTLPGASPLPSKYIINSHCGADGATAVWEWKLDGYNSTDMSKAEDLISEYLGQALYHSGNSKTYEFIDSSKSPSIDSITKIKNSTAVDLNQVRSGVRSGKTVAEAFADLLTSKLGSSLVDTIKDGSGQVTGVNIKATVRGTEGNSQTLTFKEGDLSDYTFDFESLLSGVDGADIPGKLDGKGFRVYDVNNPNKWVNVLFVDGINPNDDPRPASGGHGMDIDTLVLDISDVKSKAALVKTLYKGDGDKNKQGLSQLLANSGMNLRAAADYSKNTITIYDTRRDTSNLGWGRIANGVLDNVVNDYRNTYVNDLVIQHTDKSSANIHVRIPQTTMDQIFGYKVGAGSLDDYSVLTSAKREFLLGQDYPTPVVGALDKGIQYLIDANTLIGAQIVHMESADANIITEQENTIAAESTIRDADIAKSAMDHATANILSQSTMAMLSQFNHSSSDVLGLLQ